MTRMGLAPRSGGREYRSASRRRAVWAVACCALSGAMWAAGAQAQTNLAQGWQAVVTQSPAYAAARANHQAGQTLSDQARALWRPSVMLGAGAGVGAQQLQVQGAGFSAPGFGTTQDVTFRSRIDQGLGTSMSLIVAQPLIHGARDADARRLDDMVQVSDVQWRADRQQLMIHLVQSHLAVLDARQAVRSATAERDAAARAGDAARERYQRGAIPITAVHDAQARHDLATAQLLRAQQALSVAALAYQQLTGRSAGDLAGWGDDAALMRPVDDEARWQDMARSQGPALRMAALAVDVAQAEHRRWQPGSTWSLDLVARLTDDRLRGDGPYSSGKASERLSNQWVGVQLQVPLYTGGMESARAQEAGARLEAAHANELDTEQSLEREVRSAWLAVQTGVAELKAMKQALASADLRLQATRTGFDVGDQTVLEWLDAERDRQQAESGLLAAREHVVLARLQLAALAGLLDEGTLQQFDQALAPAGPEVH
jgi:outer membrane protein